MLLQREKKILKLLLKNGDKNPLTVSQIAAEANVSTRTIKTDIKNINDELEKNSCRIQTKRGVGIWLDCNPDKREYIESLLYEKADTGIPSEVRKYYLASVLLNCENYISMESLADRFYVSKTTVLKDLNELESFWKDRDITFIKKVKYGIKVEGTERNIRRAQFQSQKNIIEFSFGNTVDKLQPLYPNIDLERLKETVKETEKEFEFSLTDVSFNEFLIRIGIMVQRVKQGIKSIEPLFSSGENHERKEWLVSQFLRDMIALSEDCVLPDKEVYEITRILKGLRYQVPFHEKGERVWSNNKSLEIFQYMLEILQEIDKKYSLRFCEDDELITSLFNHLETMIHRIQSDMYLENPLLESVKKEMPFEYEIASYIINKFNKRYGIQTTDDEIGYVTFWVGAFLEREAQHQQRQHSVSVICMTGMGTSKFISVKLKRIFPQIEVKKIISKNAVKYLKKEDQDFVITTVPLSIEDIPVVKVSVVLNETDVKNIQRQIDRLNNIEDVNKDIYACLKNYLFEEISILQCDLKTKEEAILLLANRMVNEGYADEGFVESVFEREKISDTYMGSMIAIPHSFLGHILKQGIGILTLKKPVPWGDGQAKIIFMLALDSTTENTIFQDIFKAIYNLTRNIKDIDKILKADELKKLKTDLF